MLKDYATFVISPIRGEISVKQRRLSYFGGNFQKKEINDEDVEDTEQEGSLVGFEMSKTKPCISLHVMNGVQVSRL